MKNIVREFGKRSIRVNTLRPSVIAVPSFTARYTKEQWQAYAAALPTGKAGTPEDVANLIVFLSDDEKAGYLTGGTFHVDGARIYQIHPLSK